MTESFTVQQVRQMCEHLAQPYWMPSPAAWHWQGPQGHRQGFYSPTEPGLSNLLWLASGLERPPVSYNAAGNELIALVFTWGPATKIRDVSILDAAAVLTLRDFHTVLSREPIGGNPLKNTYPLLALLAQRRLGNA